MDRKALMQAVADRAFELRIGLSRLCASAGISRTVSARWTRYGSAPTLETIGRLERALDAIIETTPQKETTN